MSSLVISIFENQALAEKARENLIAKDRDDSFDIQDAVIVEKTPEGNLQLHHVRNLTVGGAVGGAFLGLLFGVLLLNPVFALIGIVIGFIIGAVSGSGAQAGIDPKFAKSQLDGMDPGKAALCVMNATQTERLVAEIQSQEGNLHWTKKCALEGGQKQCSLWEAPGFAAV